MKTTILVAVAATLLAACSGKEAAQHQAHTTPPVNTAAVVPHIATVAAEPHEHYAEAEVTGAAAPEVAASATKTQKKLATAQQRCLTINAEPHKHHPGDTMAPGFQEAKKAVYIAGAGVIDNKAYNTIVTKEGNVCSKFISECNQNENSEVCKAGKALWQE